MGILIHIVKFSPDTAPIGHVHLLHGMEEHISRYEDFATFLMSKGFIDCWATITEDMV